MITITTITITMKGIDKFLCWWSPGGARIPLEWCVRRPEGGNGTEMVLRCPINCPWSISYHLWVTCNDFYEPAYDFRLHIILHFIWWHPVQGQHNLHFISCQSIQSFHEYILLLFFQPRERKPQNDQIKNEWKGIWQTWQSVAKWGWLIYWPTGQNCPLKALENTDKIWN